MLPGDKLPVARNNAYVAGVQPPHPTAKSRLGLHTARVFYAYKLANRPVVTDWRK